MIPNLGLSIQATQLFRYLNAWYGSSLLHHNCAHLRLYIVRGVKYQHSPLDPLSVITLLWLSVHNMVQTSFCTETPSNSWIKAQFSIFSTVCISLLFSFLSFFSSQFFTHFCLSVLVATFLTTTPLTPSPTEAPSTPLTPDGHATIRFWDRTFLRFSVIAVKAPFNINHCICKDVYFRFKQNPFILKWKEGEFCPQRC